jgi:hypothetical protein
MDSRDPHRAPLDGMTCTVCDQPVPAERVQLLARREDMTFVKIECAACSITTLGFVGGLAAADAPAADAPAAADRGSDDGDPISTDDVLAMHEFLATWQGNPRALLGHLAADRASSRGRPAPPR